MAALAQRLALLRDRVAASGRPRPAAQAVGAPTLPLPLRLRPSAAARRPPPPANDDDNSAPKKSAAARTKRKIKTAAAPPPPLDADADAAVDAATRALLQLLARSSAASEAHCFEGASALRLQGARLGSNHYVAAVSVQPDHLDDLREQAAEATNGAVAPLPPTLAFPGRRGFAVRLAKDSAAPAVVYADAGAVLRADPRRVAVGPALYARSLMAVARDDSLSPPELRHAAERRLAELQRETSAHNLAAWGAASEGESDDSAYKAWVQRFGAPSEHARAVAADPAARLGLPLLRALLPPLLAAAAAADRSPRRPRVANLMGSHGTKALALALLPLEGGGGGGGGVVGRDVLVVDGSRDNARYGLEVAAAAEAEAASAAGSVDYLVADVLDEHALFGEGAGGSGSLEGAFDAVFFELGCLHYFLDPLPLFRVCARLLRRSNRSRLVVRDFHPFSAKLLDDAPGGGDSEAARVAARRAARKGRVLLGSGGGGARDYFSEALVPTPVAFSKHHHRQQQPGAAGDEGGATALLRQHTLGDVVTAAVRAGLAIEYLEEEAGPRLEDRRKPKLFTMVCRLLDFEGGGGGRGGGGGAKE